LTKRFDTKPRLPQDIHTAATLGDRDATVPCCAQIKRSEARPQQITGAAAFAAHCGGVAASATQLPFRVARSKQINWHDMQLRS
jgi:hypothetical protein